MPLCSSCGCELPGSETLCRGCYSNRYAQMSAPKRNFWQKLGRAFALQPQNAAGFALVILILLGMTFATAPVLSFLDPISVFLQRLVLIVKLVLIAGAIVGGIWDSWHWKDGWTTFFWIMYVPVFACFLLFIKSAEWKWYGLMLAFFCFIPTFQFIRRYLKWVI